MAKPQFHRQFRRCWNLVEGIKEFMKGQLKIKSTSELSLFLQETDLTLAKKVKVQQQQLFIYLHGQQLYKENSIIPPFVKY